MIECSVSNALFVRSTIPFKVDTHFVVFDSCLCSGEPSGILLPVQFLKFVEAIWADTFHPNESNFHLRRVLCCTHDITEVSVRNRYLSLQVQQIAVSEFQQCSMNSIAFEMVRLNSIGRQN